MFRDYLLITVSRILDLFTTFFIIERGGVELNLVIKGLVMSRNWLLIYFYTLLGIVYFITSLHVVPRKYRKIIVFLSWFPVFFNLFSMDW